MYTWKDNNSDLGVVVINMQEAHDMLTKRAFTNGEDLIYEAVVEDDGAPEEAVAEVQSIVNEVLQAIDAADCGFHDIAEGEYC